VSGHVFHGLATVFHGYGVFLHFKFLPFLALTYLSIYLFIKKKREKKRGVERIMAIHVFEQLLKKASTGYSVVPRVFRGKAWTDCFGESNGYA
jgi:hypothetical protein